MSASVHMACNVQRFANLRTTVRTAKKVARPSRAPLFIGLVAGARKRAVRSMSSAVRNTQRVVGSGPTPLRMTTAPHAARSDRGESENHYMPDIHLIDLDAQGPVT